MDYSKLSDEELLKMAGNQAPAVAPSKDYSKMSDEELLALSGQQKQSKPTGNRTAEAIQGFGQGATLGYLPEAQAATYSPMEKVLDLLGGGEIAKGNAALEKAGIKAPEDTYESRLVENRAKDKVMQNSPYYSGGKLAGNLLTTSVATAGLAPAVSAIGKIGQAAAVGGAQGFLQNPEEGETRGRNALYGIGGGALGQAAVGTGGAAIRGIGNLGKNLASKAEESAFKSTGAMLKDFRLANKKDEINDVGRFMLDNGIVKAGDTFDDVAAKAANLSSKASSALDSAYSQIDKSGQGLFKKDEVVANILSKAKEAAKGNQGGPAAVERLSGILSEILPEGDTLTASDMRAVVSKLGKDINWSDLSSSPGANATRKAVAQKAYFGGRDLLNNKADEVASALGGDVGKTIKDNNKILSNTIKVEKIAEDRVQRESARNFDNMLTGAGAIGGLTYGMYHGGPEEGIKDAAIGAAAGQGSKLIRNYGPALMASGLNAASKLFSPITNSAAPITNAVAQKLQSLTPAQAAALGLRAEDISRLVKSAMGGQ